MDEHRVRMNLGLNSSCAGRLIARLISDAFRDWASAVRSLRSGRRFPAVTLLVLALSIGLNTAVFCIADSLLWRKFAVVSPHQLVYVYDNSDAALDIEAFAERSKPFFSGVAAHSPVSLVLSAGSQDQTLFGELVTANYFDLLGVAAIRGRTFVDADDKPEATQPTIVISDDLWTRAFGRQPSVVGSAVKIENRPYIVIGIAEPSFRGLTEAWRPSSFWITPRQYYGQIYRGFSPYLIGRLRPGIGLVQARKMLSADPDAQRERTASGSQLPPGSQLLLPATAVVSPFAPTDGSGYAGMVATSAMLIAGMVLLIAMANTTGLLAARGVSRTRELAIRQAIGASRSRIARQLLAETALMCFAGAALGLLFAQWLIVLYRAVSPSRLVVPVDFNAHALAFVVIISVLGAIVISLAPVTQASRIDLVSSLGAASGGGSPSGYLRQRLRWVLFPQIILSTILLVIGGGQAKALLKFEVGPGGYQVDDVILMRLGYRLPDKSSPVSNELAPQGSDRSRQFYARVLERVSSVNGVLAAGLASRIPVDIAGMPRNVVSRDAFVATHPSVSNAFGAYGRIFRRVTNSDSARTIF
jgi:predicted permease